MTFWPGFVIACGFAVFFLYRARYWKRRWTRVWRMHRYEIADNVDLRHQLRALGVKPRSATRFPSE